MSTSSYATGLASALFHSIKRYSFGVALALSVTLTVGAGSAFAQNLDRFASPKANATAVVDHSSWDQFLGRYLIVDNDNVSRIDYDGARADLAGLNDYISFLEAQTPSQLNGDEAQAYWINFYNALTVKVILDNYPVKSIRDIDGFLGLGGPWKRKRVTVEGENISLDNIEHGILRPVYQDPRIHYGVNCASYSCPNLAGDAYTADNLNQLLDAGAVAYVNHPRGVTIKEGRLTVSSIYSWFQDDFGGTDQSVIDHLKLYAQDDLAQQLAGISRIGRDTYDWALNDIK